MRKLIKLLSFFFLSSPGVIFAEAFVGDDLLFSLEKLYGYNPKLKYERESLKSKDELYPQALSEFRPEISGYYEKGKVDTNSEGFNITSDGVRTESNKGLTITQKLYNGGSSLSNLQVAKNEIYAQRFHLKKLHLHLAL